MLERLSNEQEILYLGIKGQDVTADIAQDTGLPEGLYISEAVAGSRSIRQGYRAGMSWWLLTEWRSAV